MPIWHILHSSNTFTTATEKGALARDITKLYVASKLPAFYVNVFFHRFEPGDAWYGGQPLEDVHVDADGLGPGLGVNGDGRVKAWGRPFVHFEVDQIAVQGLDDVWAEKWCDKVDSMLKPHVADKDYDWEFHIDETPRQLWRINGMSPPPWRSAAERRWFDENRASSYTAAEAKKADESAC